MKKIIAIIALLALSGCATLGKPDTFAKCATADVAVTTVGLATGTMAEANPLTNALAIKALGPVAGTVVPLIGLSVAAYYVLKKINSPALTATATVLTCGAVVNNVAIIGGVIR